MQLPSHKCVKPFEMPWNSCLELLIQVSVGLLWTPEMLIGRDLKRSHIPVRGSQATAHGHSLLFHELMPVKLRGRAMNLLQHFSLEQRQDSTTSSRQTVKCSLPLLEQRTLYVV